jgi:hypothetical protein
MKAQIRTTTDTKLVDLDDTQWDAACVLLLGIHSGRFNADLVATSLRRRRYNRRRDGNRQVTARESNG